MKQASIIGMVLLAATAAFVAYPPAPVISGQPVYNVVDFGAVGDGNPANATKNTVAFQKAIDAASNQATPGAVYVPPSLGFPVNDGQLKVNVPNVVIRGDSTMGSTPEWGATSTIIGVGAGHTISVLQGGCSVTGINFVGSMAQTGADACLMVTGTNQSMRDLRFYSPNVGLSLQLPPNVDGEFWVRDVLVQGTIKTAGIVANAGNATVHFSHVIMYGNEPQPPYGICVTSCGELIVNNGCDLINCGSCLAIVPGLGGVQNQHCNAIFVSDSLFDGGNGQGAFFIQPTNKGYVLTAKIVNSWASTARNGLTGDGQYPTNGFTIDGSLSTPALPTLKSVQDVSFTNCVAKGFIQHCGWYCRGVNSLSLVNCTAGACYNGVQIAPGCTDFIICNNKFGNYVPPAGSLPSGGNTNVGLFIEPNLQGIVTGNMLRGNRGPGYFNQAPTPLQVVGLNIQ